jgi:GLPGLI family protein
MKLKSFTLYCLLFFNNISLSQNNGEIIYEFEFQQLVDENNEKEKNKLLFLKMIQSGLEIYENGEYKLIFNNDKALFSSELMKIDINSNVYRSNSTFFTYEEFFIESKLGSTYFVNEIFGKNYLINFERPIYKIHDEFKMIKEHKVQKATFNINPKQFVEIWFMTDIKIPFGPTIFQHLPGLVLEAKVTLKDFYSYSYKAKNIKIIDKNIEIKEKDNNLEIISYEEMDNKFKSARKNKNF